ncbi:hypothetical protein AVEN_123775-1 [Araneus ventricosus]|uniref:Uncharacterized protein n=1 Tax=Araneus ventricosus TaxID=182803 RepID=A0A4Y2BLL4_ARAVE|nr:hypothetical protein AVEN_123775-1 [Araneus ventricosus]
MNEMHEVSKPAHKTPVLTYLKQCVKKIEDEVCELKHSFNSIAFEEEEGKISFCLEKGQNIKKEINYLQHDCEKFKSLLNTDIERTKSYFYDMEDLTLDIEEEVGILEKHLMNYGYVPPELDTSSVQESESVFDDSCCENEISEKDLSLTPEFDIDVVSFPQKRDKEEATIENEPSTPALIVQVVEPEKKPRHILLSSPLPFPDIGSASKLDDVARRLDF